MKKSAIARKAPTSTASRAGVEMRRCSSGPTGTAGPTGGGARTERTSVAVMPSTVGGSVAGYQSLVILVPAYLVTPSYAGHDWCPWPSSRKSMTSRQVRSSQSGQRSRARPARPRRGTSDRAGQLPAQPPRADHPGGRRAHHLRPRGAPRACAARRSPSSPGWASPGTPGSSRAATSRRRRRCWTRSAARCGSTGTSATHLFRLADVPDPSSPDSCTVLPDSTQLLLDRLDPYPALRGERPLRRARLQQH